MAQEKENILQRLGNLLQSNIVIRKTGDNRLVVKDLDFNQSGLLSNFVDRYSKIMGGSGFGSHYSAMQNSRNAYEVARTELFREQTYLRKKLVSGTLRTLAWRLIMLCSSDVPDRPIPTI